MGDGVREFSVGDQLVGRLADGTAATYVTAPAKLLTVSPPS
ncbi:hypothetical protein [Streptomyces sp. NPDC058664]